MAHKIEVGINPRYRTIDIVDCEINNQLLDVEFPQVSRGCILPRAAGFPFKLEPPLPSFKVFRALYEHGFGDEAKRCIANRKRSTVTPDNVWAGVLAFGGDSPRKLDHPHYGHVLNLLREELRVDEKIEPLQIREAMESIPQNTSPGLPFIITHPGKKKGDILSTHAHKIDNYWRRIGEGKPNEPLPDCAAFARSHISKIGDNKVRPVWAYPLHVLCEEARYAVPLTRLMKNQDIMQHSAYGMEMMKGGMTWLNHQLKRAKADGAGKFLCADFSAFDASIPAWLIRDIFKIIAEKFNMDAADQRKYKRIVNYFINTPIRNMDGRRFEKDHGIPSGTMFTNIMGTCVNFVMMHFTLPLVAGDIKFLNCFGDDSITALTDKSVINVADLSSAFRAAFGVELNVKKSYWTASLTNIHYLGYYNYHGDPHKPTAELVASMMYPQYFKDDWGYCIARAVGCALASCGNMNIFLMARAVYTKGKRENSENPMRGLELLQTNARMRRHLETMGCGDWNFSEEMFQSVIHFMPRLNCNKLLKDI